MTSVAVGGIDAPPAAAPLPNESGSGANWILIAGIVLILLGGGYAVVGRLRGG
jgi:hypothetical protein